MQTKDNTLNLKQAPRAWFHKFSSTLIHLGFQSAEIDRSMFFQITSFRTTILLLYVDGVIITGSDSNYIRELITLLDSKFA